MPATLQHVGKSKSKQFVYEQQRALPDNKKPDTINRRKRQKRMKEKLSTKEVCPKKVIDCNAVILKKRPLKSIEKDPNLQKDIPDISDDISKSLTSKSQIESEYFKILIKETGLVIQRLSEKLDEVEANTYKGLVDARVEENGYKKSEFENENPMQKINADFTKMDEIIRHLQTHVICNSQRTVQDIPFVAEINYLRNANYELKKDVNDLKLRLYKLQLQRLRQQEYDSDENGRTDLISQQRKTPALVYITD